MGLCPALFPYLGGFEMKKQLLIKNGRIVSPEKTWAGDILVEDGKIAAMGQNLSKDGCDAYDASGCLLFPGFIDAHTHLDMDTGATVTADDFSTGTQAAICGGTTTLIDFATQDRGMTLAQALETWHKKADNRSFCDFAFHMAITDWNDTTRAEIAHMVKAGITSFKLYMAYNNLRVTDGEIYEILKAVGRIHGIIGVHCENGDLVNEMVAENLRAGRTTPNYHPLSRPDFVEAEAISRYCYLAEAAGVPIHIVHLSTALGLAEVRKARARGTKVYVETCPQYLTLDASLYESGGFEAAKYVCSPPLRASEDQAALWGALKSGEIQTISTDHCSFNFKGQKELGKDDFSKIPNGMPGLEHRPAAIYTAGVAAGRITENDMARLCSENAARLFGLYPRKGVLAVGSDADIVVWDPAAKGVIRAAKQHHNCDYTPYEGMETRGSAKAVFLRGDQAVENGQPAGGVTGQYLSRGESEYF